jgi:hypothetical protein
MPTSCRQLCSPTPTSSSVTSRRAVSQALTQDGATGSDGHGSGVTPVSSSRRGRSPRRETPPAGRHGVGADHPLGY